MSKRADRRRLGLSLVLAAMLLGPHPAAAHAARVHAGEVQAVRVEGRFESGEPMAGAQVSVFAPGDAAQPWRQGRADAAGVFLFVPDDRPGRWSVRLRLAGHGAIAHLELAPGAATEPVAVGGTAPSPVQKTVMAACVVWGCIGTALYFRRARAG